MLKAVMERRIHICLRFLIQVFSLTSASPLLCQRKLSKGSCSSNDSLLITRVTFWSDLRCQALCMATPECTIYYSDRLGDCWLYKNGFVHGPSDNAIRFELTGCETVYDKALVTARMDFWDVVQQDLDSLFRWLLTGGDWAPADRTFFIALTFPHTLDDYGMKILRVQAMIKADVLESRTIRFKFRPSGIGRIINYETNVGTICKATNSNIDGSVSCDLDYTLAPNKMLMVEAYSAKGVEAFMFEMLIVNGEAQTAAFSSRLTYPLPEKPVIVMNTDQILEISNELLVLRPTITGSLPITGYWMHNGVKISNSSLAIAVDTRLNQHAYGLYQLYAENRFGSASFHVIVKPPMEEIFSVKRLVLGETNRVQAVVVSHRFSGLEQRTFGVFSETKYWSATLLNVAMQNNTKNQVKILQANISKHGGLSFSADLSFETMSLSSNWTESLYSTTYNYTLLANDEGHLGGVISLSHLISDSILWICDLDITNNTNFENAAGKLSVSFEDKGVNARNGQYPSRMPFNVTFKVELDENSNRPIHNAMLALQFPIRFINILLVAPILARCSCSMDLTLSKGLIKLQATTLNFEQELQVIVTLIAKDDETRKIPVWITSAWCYSENCKNPETTSSMVQIYITNDINLALKKKANQSSMYLKQSFGNAAKAVDGTIDSITVAEGCAHTNSEPRPWWQVDLGARFWVEKVMIHARTDCCSERLNNVVVTGGSDPAPAGHSLCGQIENLLGAAVALVRCPNGFTGSYFHVSIPVGVLTVCEVQIYGNNIENLALRKMASQSSLGHDYGTADKGVDGNSNSNFEAGSCTHTDYYANSWWQVNLACKAYIEKVIIYNRMECCSQRLSNAKVTAGYDPTDAGSNFCGSTGNMYGVAIVTVECPTATTGMYVRITGASDPLTVCEVQVMGSNMDAVLNLALRKTATQSSEYVELFFPSNAVDGDASTYVGSGTCMRTNYEVNPWWQVDLNSTSLINEVHIYPRMDCCFDRANNLTVTGGHDPSGTKNQLCGKAEYIAADTVIAVGCQPALVGRYVRLSIPIGYLALCEVKVLGTYLETQKNEVNVSYLISETDCRFFICVRGIQRDKALCFVTANKVKSWIALPAFLYDIQGYDAENCLLTATDRMGVTMYVKVDVAPMQVSFSVGRLNAATINATYLSQAQLCHSEQQNVAAKVCSWIWTFTQDGIKENGYYIFRWTFS